MNKPVKNYDHKTIQMRRGSTSEWRRYGVMCIPAEGEMCVEFFQGADGKRTGRLGIKVGNGASPYSELEFLITDTIMDGRISNEDIARWNEAYQWGDHASMGYIVTEVDPYFTASPAHSITNADIKKWDEAHGWDDHASMGYLTEELDPIFTSSPAGTITTQDISKWNESNGWGNHGDEGYLKVEEDPVFTSSPAGSITDSDIVSWNEAKTWGDHAQEGYLTEESDPVFTSSPAAGISDDDIAKWNNPPSGGITEVAWGDIKEVPAPVAGLADYNLITGGSFS